MKRLLINLVACACVLLAGLLCLRLDGLWPMPLPSIPEFLWGICLFTGLGLILMAEAAFLSQGGATGAPADPTKRLVISGIYRWVRNPIYLGGMLVILGAALARRSPTLLAAAVLFLPVMHCTVVRGEERRLESEFGSEYREYTEQVPRWIPRIRRSK
jgi:protein-S-isoprenylcysteine O-methyltransferase Ste14